MKKWNIMNINHSINTLLYSTCIRKFKQVICIFKKSIYFVFLFGFLPVGSALLVICLLLIWRHKSNIQNLLNGTETRIGSKKSA